MSLHLHWYLPTNGDSREIVGSGDDSHVIDGVTRTTFRRPTIDYLADIARTAERLGFEAVLTPTGTWCEDAWITTAALTQVTKTLKFLVAFRPGLVTPTLAAHQAATFQRISGGRLLLNIVTGGDPVEQKRFGDWLDHDQRYQRTGEFLAVMRGVSAASADKPFDFEGKHYTIEAANIDFGAHGFPQVFFGGASPAAETTAAAHVDTYLAWGETPSQVKERLARMRDLAAKNNRSLSFGIRLHVISRDTEALAWTEADRLLAGLSPARIAEAQSVFSRTESVGQQRMTALSRGVLSAASARNARDYEVSPNLWSGYGLVRGGAGTALVGSHEQVADRIEEYHALGFDHFILSGQPHIEEAYHFAEGAAAVLRARRLIAARAA